MDVLVRMKTGLFERTTYRMEKGEKELVFVPVMAEGEERIVLNEKDLLSVTLTEHRLPELEIQTHSALYEAVFEEGVLFEDALDYLKEHLNVKITCEYNLSK